VKIIDLHRSKDAWAAWHACADALEEAGAAAVIEELSTTVREIGPHMAFDGFSRWATEPLKTGRLAVVVEGSGWAIDDVSRTVLHAGQAAFWRAGEYSSYGADRDMAFRDRGGMSRALELRGTVYGGCLWEQDHSVVFVKGGGWVADDRTRRTLRPGQGAFWPSGSWFACGSDPLAEIRMPGGTGVSVEAILRHRPDGRRPTN
jgi:hypothetical protein